MTQKSSPRLATLVWTPPFRRRVPKSMFSGSWERALLDGAVRECDRRQQNSFEVARKNKNPEFSKFTKREKQQNASKSDKSAPKSGTVGRVRGRRQQRADSAGKPSRLVPRRLAQNGINAPSAFLSNIYCFLFQKNLRFGWQLQLLIGSC